MSCILSIETCTSYGSLALQMGDQLKTKEWHRPGSHSEIITTELMSLLTESGVELADLSAITVGIGPGSFTGIRIGVNLAKSLAYSLNLPVHGFDTLTGLASQIQVGEHKTLVCLNAFRNLIYTATFRRPEQSSLNTIKVAAALTVDEIFQQLDSPVHVIGTAIADFEDPPPGKRNMILSAVELRPKAQHYLELLNSAGPKASSPKDWNQVSPLYVRASEAEEKLKSKDK